MGAVTVPAEALRRQWGLSHWSPQLPTSKIERQVGQRSQRKEIHEGRKSKSVVVNAASESEGASKSARQTSSRLCYGSAKQCTEMARRLSPSIVTSVFGPGFGLWAHSKSVARAWPSRGPLESDGTPH
eukprot:4898380-Amphidinium_carterae.1